MIIYFKDFILNMFFVCVPLFFYPYIQKVKGNLYLHRFFLFILFAFGLVLTMLFPLDLGGLIYDFRSIPLTLGALYGGVPVASLLFLTLINVRFHIGPNGLLYALSVVPAYTLVIFARRKYEALPLYQKIALSIALCSLIKLLTITAYLLLTDQIELLANNPVSTLETYAIQGVAVAFCVYLIEFLNRYFRMQEEILKSEKMKIVSDMAASVAHEIRNPLTTVRGFIQLLGSEETNAERRDYYKKICLEELDSAQLIISDYLTLAKPDPENIENIDVNQEITYLSNVLLTYANFNNVQIHVTLNESNLRIVGDRYKLRQAFINIGKNAIEAMPNKGTLEFKVNKEDGRIVIRIIDTGIGMSQEQIGRLGTPYFSTKEKGTGLGTMVSFGIIKKMDGKIDVASELGQGTSYTISFPIQETRAGDSA